MSISIVYEDNWLLAVNKPSGLLSIPAGKKQSHSLLKILNDDLKKKNQSYRLHICHRLDKQTSGLIIFSKGKSTQKKMMQAFKEKKINKTYFAFANSRMRKSRGLIRNPVGGRKAITSYQVLKRKKDYSLVKVKPLTGRKNQIRLHFKQIGHPILGEDRFAFRRDFKIKAKRLCLHAQGLDFLHPVTSQPIHLEAELPEYFKRFL